MRPICWRQSISDSTILWRGTVLLTSTARVLTSMVERGSSQLWMEETHRECPWWATELEDPVQEDQRQHWAREVVVQAQGFQSFKITSQESKVKYSIPLKSQRACPNKPQISGRVTSICPKKAPEHLTSCLKSCKRSSKRTEKVLMTSRGLWVNKRSNRNITSQLMMIQETILEPCFRRPRILLGHCLLRHHKE